MASKLDTSATPSEALSGLQHLVRSTDCICSCTACLLAHNLLRQSQSRYELRILGLCSPDMSDHDGIISRLTLLHYASGARTDINSTSTCCSRYQRLWMPVGHFCWFVLQTIASNAMHTMTTHNSTKRDSSPLSVNKLYREHAACVLCRPPSPPCPSQPCVTQLCATGLRRSVLL